MPWYLPLEFAIKQGRYLNKPLPKDAESQFPVWARPVKLSVLAEEVVKGTHRRLWLSLDGVVLACCAPHHVPRPDSHGTGTA